MRQRETIREQVVVAYRRDGRTVLSQRHRVINVKVNQTMIVEVKLPMDVLKWFAERYHIHDISDPEEMGRAVMRLLKEEAAAMKRRQLQQGG